MGCKNYNPSFVNGSTKFGKSAVKNHANTMMHSEAVKLDKIEKAKEVGEKYVTKLTPTGPIKLENVLRNRDQWLMPKKNVLKSCFMLPIQ